MRRLHWRIYLALLASLLVFGVLLGALWRQLLDPPADLDDLTVGELVAVLPPADAPREAYAKPAARLSASWGATVAVFDENGRWLGGSESLRPALEHLREHRLRDRPLGRAAMPPMSSRSNWPGRRREIDLPDGRTVRLWQVRPFGGRPPHPLYGLVLVGLAAAASSYAVARSLTRRLERVKHGMEAFGAGNLATRAPVEGRDEIAGLAKSFNHAAERIQQLVASHKALLANASHELRSPLTRLRMAVELLPEAGAERRPELEHEAARSLAEIDGLVEEILTASRLEAQPEAALQRSSFDLLEVVREEGGSRGALVSGSPTPILADERLLRRAVRNLIDNALRHGAPPVEAAVSASSGFAEVRVSDHGAGVPEAERERIFEPFYRRPGKSEAESGTGLGLALVRRIARAHGGDVWVASSDPPGIGAVLVLRIAIP